MVKKKMKKKELETEIELIKQNQRQLNEMIKDIHGTIIGNGKPGLKYDIQALRIVQESHSDLLKIHSKILDSLNIKLAIYAGAVGAIVFIVTLFADKIIL